MSDRRRPPSPAGERGQKQPSETCHMLMRLGCGESPPPPPTEIPAAIWMLGRVAIDINASQQLRAEVRWGPVMASEYAISFRGATIRSDGAGVGGVESAVGAVVGGVSARFGTRLNYPACFVAEREEQRPKLQPWIVQTDTSRGFTPQSAN